MGCDIHGTIEVKQHRLWRMAINIEPFVGRNYRAFASLFGVRNRESWDYIPVASKRGLPEDVATDTNTLREYWELDGHSDSYLTYEEIVNIPPGGFDGAISDDWSDLFARAEALAERFEDVRMVVWFDN